MHLFRARPLSSAVVLIVSLAALRPIQRLIATAGDLDPSFGIGGAATAPVQSGYVSAVAVEGDGKIVAAGSDRRSVRIARFNPDGSLDTSFGVGGLVAANLSSEDRLDEAPIKVLARPDGRIVVVATFDGFFSPAKVAVLQYSADGSLDPAFGSAGIGILTASNTLQQFTDAALQPDGGILVVGHAYFGPAPVPYIDFTVSRFTPGGAVDTSFGTNGLVHTNIYGTDEAFAIAVQPDGRFVLAGFSDTTSASFRRDFSFIRYLPDGTLDPSFGTDGRVTVDPAPGSNKEAWVSDVLIQPDGRIVASGYIEVTSPQPAATGAAIRLLSDGQLDPSFSDDGRLVLSHPAIVNKVLRNSPGSLSMQPNGRLLASFGTDAVIGIRPDGTLDPEFHGDGAGTVPATVYDMTLQDDGKIVIGSYPTAFVQPSFRVFRLTGENTPPALTPTPISVPRGTAPRLTIGIATDASDPFANLVVAPVAATVPAGLTFSSFLINATTGAVSAIVAPSCSVATGTYEVQFSITDLGTATTFATVSVQVLPNALPALSIGDRTLVEGDAGSVSAALVVTANGTVCAPITVNYTTADGTAAAPGDYTAAAGTATIVAGQTSTTIAVPVIGERVAENDERFFVNLDGPVNATIADGQGVVTIRNDEPSVIQFTGVTSVDLLETDAPLPGQVVTLKLVRLTGLESTALVTFSFTGSASFSDFSVPSDGPYVTFIPGQSEAEFPVTIRGDLLEEGTETLTLTIQEWLFSSIGTPSTAQITIRDNDGAPSDPDAPVIVGSLPAPANAAGWHRADVPVTLTGSDGSGSGVQSISYSLNGAAPVVVPSASAALLIDTEGITTVTFTARDVAGNVSAPQTLTVRLDKTAPGAAISSPQARAYTVNEVAAAAYACTDGGSGIATCIGTTAAGAAIDTATTGAKSFTATATDLAGNTTTVTVPYTVVTPPPAFRIRPLYDALKENNAGSAIPIKLQIENAAGVNVSSATLILEARFVSSGTEIGPAEEEALDAGQSNPLGRFRFVADGAYLFNLKTTGLKAGAYVLAVRVAGDTALHAVPFLVR